MKLTVEQTEEYRRDGFVSPLEAFSDDEVKVWRQDLERMETAAGGPGSLKGTPLQFRPYLHQGWAAEIVGRTEILDAVESLIGPNILAYHLTIWIKEPNSSAYVSWHQDSTYFGLTPFEHVTAWIALTDATEEMGCMRMIPGSHHRGETVLSEVRDDSELMLRQGQALAIDEDKEKVVPVPLKAGQFSLHHTLTMHYSASNLSDGRRIGLGISYIPTDCRNVTGQRVSATLVRGQDDYGHFDLEPPFDPNDPQRGRECLDRSVQEWNAMRAETAKLVERRMKQTAEDASSS
jgi:hypothetical protein